MHQVTVDRSNLRNTGQYGAPVIKTLDRGTKVDTLGPTSDETGFVKIRIPNGSTGFIYSGLLRPTTSLQTLGCGTSCGTERWAVKTAVDDDASSIDNSVTETTVDELRAITAPKHKPPSTRVLPDEKRRFRVNALLIGWKSEDDSDFHIVIGEPTKKTHTMVIESVDPACKMACSSAFNAKFKLVRKQLEDALGEPTASYRKLPKPKRVVVTGVGFFDFLHGQTGVAPNGIEIHPILDIQFEDSNP